jgi:hypothetical protein
VTDQVLLGFTVPEGEPFYIPIAHTVLTGMTTSGKTTAAEAILNRAPKSYKSLVFLTKRGEKVFRSAKHYVQPFYREKFDWEYVRSLLEATMKEKLKFETPWIIRICKQADVELRGRVSLAPGEGLRVVRKLLGSLLTSEKGLRELDRNMYTLLAAYLDKVLPTLESASASFSKVLTLEQGINVMDLTRWYVNEEVQMLVIRACMDEVLKTHNDVIIALPEAWKLLPQSRNTPVKLVFEKYIREGATNNNFLHIDAQDLGGVDKTPLRQVSIWIMGHMMQFDEVERLLKQTIGVDIKPKEIQTLPLGHFVVVTGDKVTKIYVRPDGISEDIARMVAKREMGWTPERVKEMIVTQCIPNGPPAPELPSGFEPKGYGDNPIVTIIESMAVRVQQLETQVADLKAEIVEVKENLQDISRTETASVNGNAILTKTTMHVKVEAASLTFNLNTKSLDGKIMWVAKEGGFNEWKTASEIEKLLTDKGWSPARIQVYHELADLVHKGFLGTRKSHRQQWKLADFVKFEG